MYLQMACLRVVIAFGRVSWDSKRRLAIKAMGKRSVLNESNGLIYLYSRLYPTAALAFVDCSRYHYEY